MGCYVATWGHEMSEIEDSIIGRETEDGQDKGVTSTAKEIRPAAMEHHWRRFGGQGCAIEGSIGRHNFVAPKTPAFQSSCSMARHVTPQHLFESHVNLARLISSVWTYPTLNSV